MRPRKTQSAFIVRLKMFPRVDVESKKRGLRTTITVLLATVLTISALPKAQGQTLQSRFEPPEVACERTSRIAGPKWSEAEHWLWMRVCSGKNTDFREAKHIEPTIRPNVFREIVTNRGIPDGAARKPIGILGIHLSGSMDLSDAYLERTLIIAESQIDGEVRLSRLKAQSTISLGGSSVKGSIHIHGAEFAGSVILRETETRSIEIRGSIIEGTVDLAGAHVRERVEIDASTITGSILMNDQGRYGAVRLRSTSVGRQISLQDSRVDGILDIQEIQTPGSVLLGKSHFGQIRIVGTRAGGTLSLDDSTVAGVTSVESSTIGRGILARNANFGSSLDVIVTRITGNIDLRGSHLTRLDLSETQAANALQLASGGQNVKWSKDSTPEINLHQTKVGSLQDTAETWPERLERELDGFSYNRFGGLQSDASDSGYQRSAKWLIEWIEADASYSPQPYEHLADVLEAVGQQRKAERIRVANRDRERSQYPIVTFRWVWLGVQKWAVGYGYGLRPFRLLIGLGVLTICGMVAAARGTKRYKNQARVSWGSCFWYSLDTAVPLLRLQEEPYDEPWKGCIKYYFYIHRIIGYIIALWVVAVFTHLVG